MNWVELELLSSGKPLFVAVGGGGGGVVVVVVAPALIWAARVNIYAAFIFYDTIGRCCFINGRCLSLSLSLPAAISNSL